MSACVADVPRVRPEADVLDPSVLEAVAAGELRADRVERYQLLWQEITEQGVAREERERRQSRGRRPPPRR